jgi:hypothetical protein
MSMTPEKIRDICAALAQRTGHRYEMTEPDPRATITEHDSTTGAILCQICLSVGYDKKLGMWTTYPYSVSNAKHKIGYFVMPNTTIHANPDRPAPDLAADIARRLLPAARADWGKMRENYHKEAARAEQLENDMGHFLAISPKITKDQGGGPQSGRFSYYAEGVCIGGEMTPGYGVNFTRFRVTPELAARVMELVTRPQNWSQLQEKINQ